VEDELIHAEALKMAIEEAGLELAGECGDADRAFDLVAAARPDLLLVDIALPGINNGITLAERIRRELQIPHIFTTSFSQEEVIRQAVKTNPAAYLRKPVDPANLRAAAEIALKSRENSRTSGETASTVTPGPTPAAPPELPLPPVFTRIGDKLVRIHPEELLMVRADGENYISLVFEKKEISCRTTLKEFCSQLPPSFVQVHRSYVINLNHLDAFNEQEQTTTLKGRHAPVGRTFRKAFLDSIRKI